MSRAWPESVTGLSGRKVAVIGGGGFIGTHLCHALARAGAEVAALGRSRLDPAACDPRVAWCRCELGDDARLRDRLRGVDVVYHLASTTTPALSEADPAGDVADNVVPSIRLMEAAASHEVRRLVFVSSGGTVYGVSATVPVPETAATEPISAHGLQKLAIERYLALFARTRGLDSIVLRVSNPYGPLQRARRSQGVVAAFVEAGLRARPIEIWGDGMVTRDFVFIDDVVDALLRAASHRGPSRVFNVGSGHGTTIAAVADHVETVLGRGMLTRLRRPARPADVPVSVLDVSRIRSEMGWRPRVSFTEGLRQTAAWMESQALAAAEGP